MKTALNFLILTLLTSCGLNQAADIREITSDALPEVNSELETKEADTSDAVKEDSLEKEINETVSALVLEKAEHLDVSYGENEAHKLDIYLPKREETAKLPVAVMVHGGGWFTGDKSAKKIIGYKKDYFHKRGYAFVSVNYRLAPEYMYPAAPNDVAGSLSFLKLNKEKYGLDTSKVILIGHSAGAHLINLISTNERFLNNAGFERANIKAVVSLDTYFYNIENSLEEGGERADMIENFFGTSALKMKDGSPVLHVDENTPNLLCFNRYSDFAQNIKDRASYMSQIKNKGKLVEGKIIPEYSHGDFNELFGKDGDQMTEMANDFFKKLELKLQLFTDA